MRIVPTIAWQLDGQPGEPLDERLLPLLEAVRSSASLAAAVADCSISYSAAWGVLRYYRRNVGVPLVLLERGRGASLTDAGEDLLAAHKAAHRRLGPVLPGLGVEIGALRRATAKLEPMPRLRIAASHDLALTALVDELPTAGITAELTSMGSLQALREFAEGRSDVAGFHIPVTAVAFNPKPFRHYLRVRRDRLMRFVDREQGLILPPGNPAQVRGLRDVAVKGLRFVNRQRGSGTRLLIDQMLTDSRLEPKVIRGYQTEEFTHAAVAATVASGGADVSFGVRAAAAEYRLAFVPLARERYFLAVRVKDLKSTALTRLIEALRSEAFQRIVRRLAGYRLMSAGTVVGLDALDPGNIGPAPSRSRDQRQI
jgi:putative molybdopterin biosynthesis protein